MLGSDEIDAVIISTPDYNHVKITIGVAKSGKHIFVKNTCHGSWIRHLNKDGTTKSGNINSINWKEYLGDAPFVPISADRYYNWT